MSASPAPILLPHREILGLRKEHLIQYGVTLLTAILVLAPILPILYQSLIDRPLYDAGGVLSLHNYAKLATSAAFHKVIWNTLLFSVLTTIVSVAVGTVLAVLVGRTDMPGRKTLGGMLLWPLYLSPLVVAFGWVIMYGPAGYVTLLMKSMVGVQPWNLYTIPGMAIVASMAEIPLAYLYCSSSAAVADPSLEDAARSAGAGPLRIFLSVTLPLMRPPVLTSTVLIFTASLEMLSIPLILGNPAGIDFFSSFLYTEGLLAATPDYGLIGAAAMLLLVIVTGLVIIQGRFLRESARFVTVRGKAARPRIFRLGWLRWVGFVLTCGYILTGAVIPIAGLVLRAFTSFLTPLMSPWTVLTLDNMKMIFEYPAYVRSITNSILIAVIGGAAATLFIALVALVAQRSDFRFRKTLNFLALYPRAMPGIIIGMGFFWAMVVVPQAGFIRNSIIGMTIAFSVRYLPTGFGAVSPMLMRLGPELDQAARTMGADWWTTCRLILFKLLKPALYSSFVLLFVQFLKEYSSATFLFAPGSEVMGVTMLQFWVQGGTGSVAALSVIQIVITVIFVYLGRKALGVKLYG
jgi:iron(III) transport system permease protein